MTTSALASLRIWGTVTSPFVRRVRIVALELGVEHQLVDTNGDDGQRELRSRSPIWKVPIAEVSGARELPDATLVFDSHAITELLLQRAGADAPLRAPASWQHDAAVAIDERNAVAVIDAALESLINVFYVGRDGLDVEGSAYLIKQRERAAAALAWLDARIDARGRPCATPRGADADRLGLPEIALVTALGWMRFRDTYPIERHPRLARCLAELDERPSFAATRPFAAR
ncbi:MAG: glutathione S-transferase [Nannocystaceae bacterium]|nr:glutathione S-transferase [Nannocystaceae bacterium]